MINVSSTCNNSTSALPFLITSPSVHLAALHNAVVTFFSGMRRRWLTENGRKWKSVNTPTNNTQCCQSLCCVSTLPWQLQACRLPHILHTAFCCCDWVVCAGRKASRCSDVRGPPCGGKVFFYWCCHIWQEHFVCVFTLTCVCVWIHACIQTRARKRSNCTCAASAWHCHPYIRTDFRCSHAPVAEVE